MTKKYSVKRSLIASVLMLCLCLTSFVGTTYAWFTDSVASANNIIQSGNLDIELKYAKIAGDKLTDWDTVGGKDNIFDKNALWEPGRAEVVYLEVSNLGSLALKYQLGVNVVSEIFGENVAGEEFKLSDHLVFKVVELSAKPTAAYTREEAVAAAGAELGLKDYNGSTTALEVGGTDYLALIVYMPESVGNEANFRGNAVPTINLGINLFATQQSAEDDSFGPDYDEDAWVEGMKVYNAADLEAAISSGDDVVLMNDIVLTESLVIPASASTFAVRAASKAQVIDLNGKTISGTGFGADGNRAHVVINNGYAVLKNGTIESTGTNGGSAILNTGVLTLENLTVNGAPSNTASGTASYAVNTEGAGSQLTVLNSDITGRGAVGATKGTKVEINGGTFHTPAVAWGHAVYAVGEGTEVVIKDGIFSEGYEMASDNWGMYQIYSGNKAKVTVYGGTFMEWDCANGYDLCSASEGTIVIYGGNFADNPSNQNKLSYVAGGYTAVATSNNTWAVLPGEKTVEVVDGLYYDNVDTYYVTNANGLSVIAAEVNKVGEYEANIFDGKTVKLMNNIDLGGAEWTPIGNFGNTSKQFTGTFDGQNYVISNFKITQKTPDRPGKDRSPHGFFGNLNGTVKNLTLKNATLDVKNAKWAGALVGRMNGGTIENCHVIDSNVTIYHWQVGGMVGQLNNGTIKNSTVEDTTVSGYAQVGALVGVMLLNGDRVIENCTVNNCALVQNGSFGEYYDPMFGGVLGALYSEGLNLIINGCEVNNTTIKGSASSAVYGYVEEGATIVIDGVEVVLPKTVTYDGVSSFQDVLNSLNPGDTLLLPAGTIVTTGTFAVPHGVTIIGDSNGGTVIHQNSAGQDDIFNCKGDVTVKNVTFESNRKGYAIADNTKNHDSAGNITVINCSFKGIAAEKNYGVYKNLNGNLTIKDCTFDNYNNAICGVSNGNGTTTTVTGCTFTNINGEAVGYVINNTPVDFEAVIIANNNGLTEENVIGY